MIARVALALVVCVSVVTAQAPSRTDGPTVVAARVAFFIAPGVASEHGMAVRVPESCGSMFKNALLMGLGVSLAAASLELVYTLVREAFVRGGDDWARADPRWIGWAGGAGFLVGLISTEVCRRRRR